MRKRWQRIFGLFVMILILTCACGSKEKEESQELPLVREEDCQEEEPQKEIPRDTVILVYVCGKVVSPGVYELPEGARVNQAIEMAGGMTEKAAADYLNLAEFLTDGQRLYVPDEGEAEVLPQTSADTGDISTGKVNLNTATKEELMTLSGIGEAKAESILAYRKEHGSFKSVEDIKKIEGIKEGTYNRIKEQIEVR